jgi:hypothetical protein
LLQDEPIRVPPENWNKDIAELENYFESIDLPTQPVKLNDGGIISNCSLFIDNHLAFIKENNGNNKYLPYLERLYLLKAII